MTRISNSSLMDADGIGCKPRVRSTDPVSGQAYAYNAANQRERADLADGSFWEYGYDDLGQVTSGKRKFDEFTFAPGQQFEYTFDAIGNRTQAKRGGDDAGLNLRTVSYTPNLLNQYTQRQVADTLDVMGYAPSASTVTINSVGAWRFGKFFHGLVTFVNTVSARFEEITLDVDPGDPRAFNVFLPQTPESFVHDDNGNLVQDGRWNYTWDGENRLIEIETRSDLPASVPRRKIEFVYDYMHRRTMKRVYGQGPLGGGGGGEGVLDGGAAAMTGDDDGSPDPGPDPPAWTELYTHRYVWDGWNLVAEVSGAAVRSYAWGLDLSGTAQGAGGIGGLLFVRDWLGPTYHYAYDGNGNVVRLGDDSGGAVAEYEYGPFGELLTAEGTYAAANPFQFSTKYRDVETGLVYYGYRYYNASTGRWVSRDPIEERGGANVYAFVENEPLGAVDALGLRRIEFGFNAFINGVRRGRILAEPFPMGWLFQYGFSTDMRDFGEFDALRRNARLYTVGSIESTDIGSFATRPPEVFTGAGNSSEYRRRTDLLAHQWEFVRTRASHLTKATVTYHDFNKCASLIRIEAAAKYPFGPLWGAKWTVPAIRYEVNFIFTVERDGFVTIVTSGSHNKFPDFEAYGDGHLIYDYFSSSSGPNHWSVGWAPRRWFRGAQHGISVQAETSNGCECGWR